MMMGRQSSLSPPKYARITTWSWNVLSFIGIIILSATMGCQSLKISNVSSDNEVLKGITITTSPIARINSRTSSGRTNSRFLRTFPRLDFLHFARRDGMLPDGSQKYQHQQHELVNGNSPVFYIRLPPVPYVLVPGLGYVSPHPYNTPVVGLPPSPVMMSPLGMMNELMSAQAQPQKNVISLPLKFLSNGRPAQIENPKKKHPSKFNSISKEPSKTTNLISGGKYSFNGRPNGVFIVRSPV